MDDKFYLYGVASGIAVGVIVLLLVILWNRKKGLDVYDERQMVGRGKAFKAGFFTLLGGMAVLFLDGLVFDLPGSPILWKFGAMMAGMMAFVLTAIHYDAYLSLTDTPKRVYTTGLLISAAMGLSAVSNFMSGSERGTWSGWVNATLGAFWLIIVTALWLHNRRRDEE